MENIIRYSLYYLFILISTMKELNGNVRNIKEKIDLKVTVLLGIILGAVVYGSFKVIQMGGVNP